MSAGSQSASAAFFLPLSGARACLPRAAAAATCAAYSMPRCHPAVAHARGAVSATVHTGSTPFRRLYSTGILTHPPITRITTTLTFW